MANQGVAFRLEVTPAAREAMGAAIARNQSPTIVRLGVLPGVHPTAQMYLSTPRSGDEILDLGPARLVVDAASQLYLDGATVDFHEGSPGGGFSISGPRFSTPLAAPSSSNQAAGGSPPAPLPADSAEADRTEGERERQLRFALRRVYDPEIPVNILDLGLIYGIEWGEEGKVHIRMTMTSPGCPVAGMLQDEVKAVAESISGIREVDVSVVWDPPWGPERMSPTAKREFGYA